MNSIDESANIPLFYKTTNRLDEIRDEKFADVFLDLHKSLNKYNTD